MGCGSSVPDTPKSEVLSQLSHPAKATAVELFDPSNDNADVQESETPIETIEWEWKASGAKRDRSIEGDSEKFKEEEQRLQLIRSNNMNARAAGEPLEPIFELEDFEDADFQGTAVKVKPNMCVEPDEASSCATPRI